MMIDRICMLIGHNGFLGRSLSSHFERINLEFGVFDPRNQQFEPSILASVHSIIWAAGRINPKAADESPELVIQDISEWRDILRQLRDFQFKGNMIFLSSGGCVYSDDKDEFTESDLALGLNSYGVAKVQMEEELIRSGLNFTILRTSNVYGPGQGIGRGQGVISEWIHQAVSSSEIHLYGSRDFSRDFLYISDFCDAISKVVKNKHKNDIYNLGSGTSCSLGEIIKVLDNILEGKLRIRVHERRNFDRLRYKLDISKFQSEFSWKPIVDIYEGMRATFVAQKS